ncbi:hypothetical protein B0182_04285 [Moraxella bovis]|nr:hypothetical protein DQF64_08295 [Moraxella bovis]OOR90748.1 hypothetical protein B0182_04285 [Moraxella bovis]
MVEPIAFPMLCAVVAFICFFLGTTFPMSALSKKGVSLANIAPNLFFASIMILMRLIFFKIFLKFILSLGKYASK